MSELIVFHHALGLTKGVRDFADELRAGGHTVHTPDLYEGRTFVELADGIAYAKRVGFDNIDERGRKAADELPHEVVYAGFSLGVTLAQMLAQTRPGARGAVLFHSAIPVSEFGERWPDGVPLQIHMMEGDEWVVPPNTDLEVAREMAATIPGAELFLYPGTGHLFLDSGNTDYDEHAAALAKGRVLTFLERVV